MLGIQLCIMKDFGNVGTKGLNKNQLMQPTASRTSNALSFFTFEEFICKCFFLKSLFSY